MQPADNSTLAGATGVAGIATQNIPANGEGYVTVQGLVHQIDTSGLTSGAPIYLSTNGVYTSTWPNNGIVVQIGYVVGGNSATSGSIYVTPQGDLSGFGSYGQFMNTTTTVLTASTATPVPLGTTSLSRNMSVTGGNAITITQGGKYKLSYILQLYNTSNANRTVATWLSKNGTAQANWVANSTTDSIIGSSLTDERLAVSGHFTLSVDPGDSYTLMVAANGSGVQLNSGASAVTSPAGIPAVTSAQVVVTEID